MVEAMRDGLSIETEWTETGAALGDPTAAMLAFRVGDHNASRSDNMWSQSLQESVHLSARPLAAWFAANWWRLRWEGAPPSHNPDHAWRMAHEVPAAGGGFLWPNVTIRSDGEAAEIVAQPSARSPNEMIAYRAAFRAVVTAEALEAGIDAFVELVIERLTTFGAGAEQASLWRMLREERGDPAVTRFRRLEALLGFDPGEAPDGLVDRIIGVADATGEGAMHEVAAACAGRAPDATLQQVLALAGLPGLHGRFAATPPDRDPPKGLLPTTRGRRMATKLRDALGLSGATGPVPDEMLAGLLGLPASALEAVQRAAKGPPVSLAVAGAARDVRFFFRRKRSTGRRFEAARFIADHLAAADDHWHPATDADTARQKVQRGFAAEFLAPIEALSDYLAGDFSGDAIEGAAEYFDVSSQTIGSQLANHHRIGRDHPSVPA
jgi:hypothetical protein